MIILTLVNTNNKKVDIVKMDTEAAVNFIRKVSFIPPQYRFIRVVAYLCTNSYDKIYEDVIDIYIDKMKPTHEELMEWYEYPIHIVK